MPYSGRERSIIAIYLDEVKANARYEELCQHDYFLDVQMDDYEVDD